MAALESRQKEGESGVQWATRPAPTVKVLASFTATAMAIAAHLVTAQREHPLWGALLFAAGLALFLAVGTHSAVLTPGEGRSHAAQGEVYKPLVKGRIWRAGLLVNSIVLSAVASVAFTDNQLARGFWLWFAAIIYFAAAFAERPIVGRWHMLRLRRRSIPWNTVAVLVALMAVAVFFRIYRLAQVPVDMTSDHAEKLLDVYDVLDGARPIFFTRNTGREAFQFYMTAALVRWTPLTVSHLALKVGTALFGILTIPSTYWLGKEMYGKRTGLFAAFLLAISHWHVAISRVGLRFPFTAAFVAPALYFLLRAMRENRRNQWLAAGGLLGLGLHTYTAMRIVPLLFVLLVAIRATGDLASYLRLRVREGRVRRTEFVCLDVAFWKNAAAGAAFAILLFLPLLRYMQESPKSFWYRASSRAQETMAPLESWLTFWENVKNALLMFNYRGDVVPMNAVPEAPVLGPVTGGLFVLGAGYVLWQLLSRRDRTAAVALTSLFILLLPSILSLAYPGENPSVVRSGGAIPLVMIVAALPLALLTSEIQQGIEQWKRRMGWLLVLGMLMSALLYNYYWYFEVYDRNIRRSIWNATEMGAVVRAFQEEGGSLQNAYHVAYPHWVDTRNIGINAGAVTWRNAVTDLSQIATHAQNPEAKIYLIYPAHEDAIRALRDAYPRGVMRLQVTDRPGKQFLVFEVPADTD